MVAEALISYGLEAEVGNAAEIADLDGYDAVIVGGALYNNRWHTDATDFLHRYAHLLQHLPLWFFSSGPLDDSARLGDLAPATSVAKLAREVEVSGHMTFGGYLDKAPKGFFARQMARRYAGDWRDPQQVAEWVHVICRQIELPSTIPAQRAGDSWVPSQPAEAESGQTTR